jgi:cell wall-associated NlpC family hydrolase
LAISRETFNFGVMTELDQRLHAFHPDFADIRLLGRIQARRFVEGQRMQVTEPLVTVHKAPRSDAMQLTQALMGETVMLFANEEGWAFVQLEGDGYVGYVAANALSTDMAAPTHRVAVPSTFLYPEPNLKSRPAIAVTMNALLTVVGGDEKFAKLSNGSFIYLQHLKGAGQGEPDFVAVAELFRNVPYYWGGKSVHGLDCSGLVQISLEASGTRCLRDSDMQEEMLGSKLLENSLDHLKRGDLVFWNGHVGIMIDADMLLHANGHHMMVVAEPLRDAVDRIARSNGQITSIRRF